MVVIAFKPASKAFFCSFMFSGVELHVLCFCFLIFFFLYFEWDEHTQLK